MSRITALKIEIVSRGLLQADVASQAGIHPSKLSQVCSGRVRLSREERDRIADVLGGPTERLFREVETAAMSDDETA